MKKQWMITALLLVAALNIYLLAFIGKQEQDPAHTLTDLDPDTITRIEIQREQDRLHFERRDGEWWMTAPFSGPANAERMTELRALAVIRPLAVYAVDEVDASRYGVETPSVVVTLNDRRIAFGDVNQANGRRYLLTNQKLFLIADNIYPILQLPATRFLTKPGSLDPET